MGKIVTILVAGVILVGGITLLAMNRVSVAFISRCVDQHDRICARSNAVSAANMAIGALARGEELQEVSNVPLFSTRVSLDTFTLTEGRIKVIARGYVQGKDTAVVEAIVNLQQSSLSFDMRAAVVAGCNFKTTGFLTVDGRDFSIGGILIPQSGTLGVSTTGNFKRKWLSTIGGTYGGTDYTPKIFFPQFLVERRAVWEEGFPDTPEKVFGGEEAGFPEGRLKEIAQSGVDGSQYVTNPADLVYPLTSLTYVELSSGGNWTNINFQASEGILVVHNNLSNTLMGTLQQGQFAGLIIADRIDAIHNQILGGIIQLTPSSTSMRGLGRVRFSREAIEQALSILQQEGSEAPLVVSWYE